MSTKGKRYRYDAGRDALVEIVTEPVQNAGPMVMPDIDVVYGGGFRSPIDGEFITSRSQLRRHEIRHGVRQAGDFKRGEIIAAEKKRVAASQPRPNDGVTFKWF